MFGGNNSRTWVDNIDAFVPGKKQWSRVSAVPKLGGYWAATSSQSHVYLVGGGVSNSIASKACLRYDFPTDEWFQARLGPSPQQLCKLQAGVLLSQPVSFLQIMFS